MTVRGERGFSLVEMLVALVLVGLAAALAAQVLQESAQMLADAAAEQQDAALPLVVARLRQDVRASASFQVLPGGRLVLAGHPAGTVVYERQGSELRRTVFGAGSLPGSAPALRGVTAWACFPVGPRLLAVTVGHRRSALRRGPLPTLPSRRGPAAEERVETILVAPRGSGLGGSW